MKKTALVIAMTAASMSAFATEAPVAEANGIKVRDVYVGAELGGNFLLGDDKAKGGKQADGTFEASNMVKVGAELGVTVAPGVEAFVATEGRFAMEGVDGDWTNGKYDGEKLDLYKATIGLETGMGRTEFGQFETYADTMDGFADLSLEHGLNTNFEPSKYGESSLQQLMVTDKFTAAVAYDFEKDAVFIGGTVTPMKGLELGMAYMNSDKVVDGEADEAYTLGAVYSLNQIDLAAKYQAEEVDGADLMGYSVGAAYHVNPALKVAATFNDQEGVYLDGSDDQWFTVGASYQVHKNVELVTDYKVGSEHDDKLFVRANINF